MVKRKQNKSATYFPHDADAHDDPKCVLLLEQLGCEGYGIFWILIETLRMQPEYKYPLNLVPAVARRFNTSAEKMNTVIRNYDLFQIDENDFFSMSLFERMKNVNQISLKRKKAIAVRWEKSREVKLLESHTVTGDTNVLQMNYNSNTKVIQEKKRKEKKIKENEREENDNFLQKTPLQNFIIEQLPNVSKLPNQLTFEQAENLIKEHDKKIIHSVLEQMENYKPLLTKYKSVYFTLKNWIKNEKFQRTIGKTNSANGNGYNDRININIDELLRDSRDAVKKRYENASQ